jgi:transposase
MAHARRKFHNVVKAGSRNPHVREALSLMAQLYAIERECAEIAVEERLASRQSRARPVFDSFHQ